MNGTMKSEDYQGILEQKIQCSTRKLSLSCRHYQSISYHISTGLLEEEPIQLAEPDDQSTVVVAIYFLMYSGSTCTTGCCHNG
ncbi:hypothetical protein UPYG_G00068700 [Umbra pygmaea]|uniref:Uncharacterized protein n=1 Tax=Umbra pygmaea TaxID=75934 RepID=A0ABD0Y0J4_UMBPY